MKHWLLFFHKIKYDSGWKGLEIIWSNMENLELIGQKDRGLRTETDSDFVPSVDKTFIITAKQICCVHVVWKVQETKTFINISAIHVYQYCVGIASKVTTSLVCYTLMHHHAILSYLYENSFRHSFGTLDVIIMYICYAVLFHNLWDAQASSERLL